MRLAQMDNVKISRLRVSLFRQRRIDAKWHSHYCISEAVLIQCHSMEKTYFLKDFKVMVVPMNARSYPNNIAPIDAMTARSHTR